MKEDLNLLFNYLGKLLNDEILIGFVEKNFSGIVYGSSKISGGGKITTKGIKKEN